VVGGCSGCATPLGAERAGLAAPSGTMPHAMILVFGDTVKSAVAFDQHMPDDVLRIVLVDTFKDEAEESLRVAEAMGERLRGVRLDTPWERGRVTIELVKEVRARLDLAGHRHVGIFVSGGLDAERVRQFVTAGAPVDSFGVGMAIAAAPPIGFTADIKEVDGEPRTKRGRIPGMIATPRLQRVV
jgi:nicotinate phosphoribosyltransferase